MTSCRRRPPPLSRHFPHQHRGHTRVLTSFIYDIRINFFSFFLFLVQTKGEGALVLIIPYNPLPTSAIPLTVVDNLFSWDHHTR